MSLWISWRWQWRGHWSRACHSATWSRSKWAWTESVAWIIYLSDLIFCLYIWPFLLSIFLVDFLVDIFFFDIFFDIFLYIERPPEVALTYWLVSGYVAFLLLPKKKKLKKKIGKKLENLNKTLKIWKLKKNRHAKILSGKFKVSYDKGFDWRLLLTIHREGSPPNVVMM